MGMARDLASTCRVLADPAKVPITLVYSHFIYGLTALAGTPFGGYLIHEYQAGGDNGIDMKSTFSIPMIAGRTFAENLARHCQQEMQMLPTFLPALFAAEYH